MVKLYYHGGSENHGCEAIVRSTAKVFNNDVVLYSRNIDRDLKYKLDSLIDIRGDHTSKLSKSERLVAAFDHKINNQDYAYIKFSHKEFFADVTRNDIYMSIGGDNYCYGGREILGYYNKAIHKKGAKTVFWGCSFEPNDMTNEIAKDIAMYDLIVSRESISYELLKSKNPNTILTCDPAFQLDSIELPLPENFKEGNTIGINVSPLIMYHEATEGVTAKNYSALIEYIIKHTDSNIALIPHVAENGNNDSDALKLLYESASDKSRICIIPDCNCMELKGYISRCKLFVGARTHATIAAYSTFVPTLVVGYSVKARGIARDIFGSEENYVLPVQNLRNENDLTNAFIWLNENYEEIKSRLAEFIPSYKETIYIGVEAVRNLMK